MTYDVQRWHASAADSYPCEDGYFVVAADAEAHEKAAVQLAYDQGVGDMKPAADAAERQWHKGYEQAIRDCIAAVEGLPSITDAYGTSDSAGGHGLAIVTRTWLCSRESAIAALHVPYWRRSHDLRRTAVGRRLVVRVSCGVSRRPPTIQVR